MLRTAILTCGALLITAAPSRAQMVTIGSPLQSNRDGFFEGINTGWSLRGPNFFATFNGGGNAAAPQFGGFNPNAGIQSGFGFSSGPFTGQVNFGAAQGASRSSISSVPMVTTLNGQPGFFTNSVQRPFVTGVVPVVGAGVVGYAPVVTGLNTPPMLSPLDPHLPWQMALQDQGLRLRGRKTGREADEDAAAEDRRDAATERTATGRAATGRSPDGLIDPLPPSRAERERREVAEVHAQNLAARGFYEKGLKAEEAGKEKVARLYFEMAAKRATGAFKNEVEQRLQPAPTPGRSR